MCAVTGYLLLLLLLLLLLVLLLLLSSVEPPANGKATSTSCSSAWVSSCTGSLSTATCSSTALRSVNVASGCVSAPQVERGVLRWLRLPRRSLRLRVAWRSA